MLIVLSPAKKLDFQNPVPYSKASDFRFPEEALTLVKLLRNYSPDDLMKLMHISKPLAVLNYRRYQEWHLPFGEVNSRQAVFAFTGDAYKGLSIREFSLEDLERCQQQLRILSALYGVLRPLDRIQPYRIEMGMRLAPPGAKNLYDFWSRKITATLKQDLEQQDDNVLINLASLEYFKAINVADLSARIISPVFKEGRVGHYKIVSSKAKRARGLMAAFIIRNQLTSPEELKLFEAEGYYYHDRLSSPDSPVFIRE